MKSTEVSTKGTHPKQDKNSKCVFSIIDLLMSVCGNNQKAYPNITENKMTGNTV